MHLAQPYKSGNYSVRNSKVHNRLLALRVFHKQKSIVNRLLAGRNGKEASNGR
jgi:hypothetical protein